MSNDSGSEGPRDGEDPLGLDHDTERAAEPAAGRESASRQTDAAAPPGASGGAATLPIAARPRGGRLLGVLALLLAQGDAALAGYLYYELLHRADVRATSTAIEALQDRLGSVDAQLERGLQNQSEQLRAALDELRRELREERAQSERALRESLADVARQAPPATSEWQRAEVQYLLRIANHRLLMERDVVGTLRLLRAADQVLGQLDDFSLHEVRAQLADEIAALQSLQSTDVQGLFLRLEAAKHDLDRLPLREPRFRQVSEPEPAPVDGLWAALWRQVSDFVRIRRLDSEVKPLLAPEEGVYLELNLRLMLERAQLAVLRGDQMIYEQSLDTAIGWIHDYLNVDERPVHSLLEELEAMRRVNLEQPLPDVSGSLNALQQVLRNPQ